MRIVSVVLWAVVAGVVIVAGCERAGCPHGYVERMGRCLDADAGTDAAMNADAAMIDAAMIDEMDAGRDAAMADAGTDAARADAGADAETIDAAVPVDACSTRLYRDGDGDGFGDPMSAIVSCTPMAGFVRDDRDCDDACAECAPGRTEICDLRNNDCDAMTDEGVTTTYFADCDRDEVAPVGAESRVGCALPRTGPTACPSGSWTGERPDIAARQDCADTDDRAFPGQMIYQTRAISGAPAERDFDFDCDGMEEGDPATGGSAYCWWNPFVAGGVCVGFFGSPHCGEEWSRITGCMGTTQATCDETGYERVTHRCL